MDHQIHKQILVTVIVLFVSFAVIACGRKNDQETAQSEWCIRGLEQGDLRGVNSRWKKRVGGRALGLFRSATCLPAI